MAPATGQITPLRDRHLDYHRGLYRAIGSPITDVLCRQRGGIGLGSRTDGCAAVRCWIMVCLAGLTPSHGEVLTLCPAKRSTQGRFGFGRGDEEDFIPALDDIIIAGWKGCFVSHNRHNRGVVWPGHSA